MINLNKTNIDIPSSNEEQTSEDAINKIYSYAANLLFARNRSPQASEKELVKQGFDENIASMVIKNLIVEYKKQASKNILYGALWFIGGIVATAANIGYIFWGAVLYGVILLVKGISQHSKFKV